jgi:hypothetical protein
MYKSRFYTRIRQHCGKINFLILVGIRFYILVDVNFENIYNV